jgi:hypothetical protein
VAPRLNSSEQRACRCSNASVRRKMIALPRPYLFQPRPWVAGHSDGNMVIRAVHSRDSLESQRKSRWSEADLLLKMIDFQEKLTS